MLVSVQDWFMLQIIVHNLFADIMCAHIYSGTSVHIRHMWNV